MIRKDYFIVKNSVVDRDDLNIYEKMCCIVLARYAGKEEYDNLLTSDIIAIKMGTDVGTAKKALLGLIEKGLIGFEGLAQDLNDDTISEESVDQETDNHSEENINDMSEVEEIHEKNVIKKTEGKPLTIDEFKERLKGYNTLKDDSLNRQENYKNEVGTMDESKPLIEVSSKKDVSEKETSLWDELEMRDGVVKFDESQKVEKVLDSVFNHEDENDKFSNISNLSYQDSEILSNLSDEAKYHLGLLEEDAYGIKSIPSKHKNQSHNEPSFGAASEDVPRYATNKTNDKEKYHSLIDQVYEIIDENINEREARIILSFADNDIDRIKEKYKIAKLSQINDKIEVLINELQRKERKPVVIRQVDPNGEEINENHNQGDIKLEEDAPPMGQINIANLNKMKMYSQFSKNNKPSSK